MKNGKQKMTYPKMREHQEDSTQAIKNNAKSLNRARKK